MRLRQKYVVATVWRAIAQAAVLRCSHVLVSFQKDEFISKKRASNQAVRRFCAHKGATNSSLVAEAVASQLGAIMDIC